MEISSPGSLFEGIQPGVFSSYAAGRPDGEPRRRRPAAHFLVDDVLEEGAVRQRWRGRSHARRRIGGAAARQRRRHGVRRREVERPRKSPAGLRLITYELGFGSLSPQGPEGPAMHPGLPGRLAPGVQDAPGISTCPFRTIWLRTHGGECKQRTSEQGTHAACNMARHAH